MGTAACAGLSAISHRKKATFWRELIDRFPGLIDFLCNPDDVGQSEFVHGLHSFYALYIANSRDTAEHEKQHPSICTTQYQFVRPEHRAAVTTPSISPSGDACILRASSPRFVPFAFQASRVAVDLSLSSFPPEACLVDTGCMLPCQYVEFKPSTFQQRAYRTQSSRLPLHLIPPSIEHHLPCPLLTMAAAVS
jgi:hypothetical protein